jgi:hypothetical protein
MEHIRETRVELAPKALLQFLCYDKETPLLDDFGQFRWARSKWDPMLNTPGDHSFEQRLPGG